MYLHYWILVCQEIISQGEWCRYVSSEIVAKYNKFNQPYRPYSRYCLSCQHSVAPCQSPLAQELSRERLVKLLFVQTNNILFNKKVVLEILQMIWTFSQSQQMITRFPHLWMKYSGTFWPHVKKVLHFALAEYKNFIIKSYLCCVRWYHIKKTCMISHPTYQSN